MIAHLKTIKLPMLWLNKFPITIITKVVLSVIFSAVVRESPEDVGRRLLQSLRSEKAVAESTSVLTADPAIAAVYRGSQVETLQMHGGQVGDFEVQRFFDQTNTWKYMYIYIYI